MNRQGYRQSPTQTVAEEMEKIVRRTAETPRMGVLRDDSTVNKRQAMTASIALANNCILRLTDPLTQFIPM